MCPYKSFKLGGDVYEQTLGTLIGEVIPGYLANGVVQALENCPTKDDNFVTIKFSNIIDTSNVINGIFEDIIFAMRSEKDRQLTFVDVMVKGNANCTQKTRAYHEKNSHRSSSKL